MKVTVTRNGKKEVYNNILHITNGHSYSDFYEAEQKYIVLHRNKGFDIERITILQEKHIKTTIKIDYDKE